MGYWGVLPHAVTLGRNSNFPFSNHKTSPSLQLERLGMSTSLYARRMARLSARIFGNIFRPTTPQSMKVIQLMGERPREQRPDVVDYYPPHNDAYKLMKRLRFLGLYRDEHADFRDEMKRVARLKGKAPPKKGEGKRAMKRKK